MKKIKTKILIKTLFITIASLLICIAASSFVIKQLKTISQASNETARNVSTQSSANSLVDQALEQTIEYTDFFSQAIKLKLNSIIYTLSVAGKSIEDIYKNQSYYVEKPFNHVSQCPDEYCMQWILPKDMKMNAAVEHETYLLGNIENHFENIKDVYVNILSIYFTTESGINIGYDNTAKTKPVNFEGRTTQWYTEAEKTMKPYISQPYNDSFERGLMVTISVPCIGDDGRFYGVLAVDFLIQELNELIKDVKVGKNGYAVIISPEMVICADGITKENQHDFDAFLGVPGGEAFKNKTLTAEHGMIETVINSEQMYAIYSKIGIYDWMTVFIMPTEGIVESSLTLSKQIQNIFNRVDEEFNRQFLFMYAVWLAILIGLILVVIYFVGKAADEISNPIIKLCSDVEKIGSGSLDYKSEIKTNDEIEELSLAFEKMTNSLKEYIDNFAKATADKQRISTELAVATQIQASVLPCIFPAFPSRTDFDIYAKMTPAKEVGGDFYDFYLIGENKLGIVMADVSGKGVPAALFMMISKTVIKNLVFDGMAIDEVFNDANNRLNEGNETLMFVTAFLAIVDLNTGVMEYVNAGHNTPLLRKKNSSFEWMKLEKNCILAVLPEVNFKKQSIQLEKGDIFFTYTDGVTEAINSKNNFYGEDKLITELNNIEDIDNKSLCDTIVHIRKTIDDFADGAEQADDITMLIFKYLGKS